MDALKELGTLRELSLDSLTIAYTQTHKLLNTHCLLEYLRDSKTLRSATLEHLGIGGDRADYELLSSLLLFNETLQSLSLRHNSISRLTPLLTAIVRNRCSNLLELSLANNAIEAEELVLAFQKTNLERESCFGNLHFKLRILNLCGNPMEDLHFKVKKLLAQFYSGRSQKLLICTNNPP